MKPTVKGFGNPAKIILTKHANPEPKQRPSLKTKISLYNDNLGKVYVTWSTEMVLGLNLKSSSLFRQFLAECARRFYLVGLGYSLFRPGRRSAMTCGCFLKWNFKILLFQLLLFHLLLLFQLNSFSRKTSAFLCWYGCINKLVWGCLDVFSLIASQLLCGRRGDHFILIKHDYAAMISLFPYFILSHI